MSLNRDKPYTGDGKDKPEERWSRHLIRPKSIVVEGKPLPKGKGDTDLGNVSKIKGNKK